jgi:hypothetical protein
MAKANFTLRLAGCDITDVQGCRSKLIDVLNDPEFENFVRGFDATLAAASGAPAPRGGEIGISCHADSGGGWGCRAEGRWTF